MLHESRSQEGQDHVARLLSMRGAFLLLPNMTEDIPEWRTSHGLTELEH